jgi:hypothetical protein
MYLATRVTRMGEFSPIGWLFTLGSFFNDRTTANFWTAFSQLTGYVFILTKNGLGYSLGDFVKNVSGHPARNGETPEAGSEDVYSSAAQTQALQLLLCRRNSFLCARNEMMNFGKKLECKLYICSITCCTISWVICSHFFQRILPKISQIKMSVHTALSWYFEKPSLVRMAKGPLLISPLGANFDPSDEVVPQG